MSALIAHRAFSAPLPPPKESIPFFNQDNSANARRQLLMMFLRSPLLTILGIAIFYFIYHFLRVPEKVPSAPNSLAGAGTFSKSCRDPTDVKNQTLGVGLTPLVKAWAHCLPM